MCTLYISVHIITFIVTYHYLRTCHSKNIVRPIGRSYDFFGLFILTMSVPMSKQVLNSYIYNHNPLIFVLFFLASNNDHAMPMCGAKNNEINTHPSVLPTTVNGNRPAAYIC